MNYNKFKMYMAAGYENDIDALREIEAGNYAEGQMTDEDIELAESIGRDKWNTFAGRYADELELNN